MGSTQVTHSLVGARQYVNGGAPQFGRLYGNRGILFGDNPYTDGFGNRSAVELGFKSLVLDLTYIFSDSYNSAATIYIVTGRVDDTNSEWYTQSEYMTGPRWTLDVPLIQEGVSLSTAVATYRIKIPTFGEFDVFGFLLHHLHGSLHYEGISIDAQAISGISGYRMQY